MNERILELGVGGIFALMLLREIIPHIKNGRNGWKVQLKDLWEWHKPDPETGRFAWYERDQEVVRLIREVNENISAQTKILESVCRESFKTRTEIIAEIKKKS